MGGPAWQRWQIAVGGQGHGAAMHEPVLICERWMVEGKPHRADGPALSMWEIKEDQQVLTLEEWYVQGEQVNPEDLHRAATIIRMWFIRHRNRREAVVTYQLQKDGMTVFPGFMNLLRKF